MSTLKTSTPRPQENSKLENVLGCKHPEMIERLRQKRDMSQEEAERLFEDTLLFLLLCTITRKPISPSPKIDIGWHEFLMYSRDYQNFCREYLGRFVHHTPTPMLGVEPMEKKVLSSKETRKLALNYFGKVSDNWKPALKAECCPDFDCHGDDSCGGDV